MNALGINLWNWIPDLSACVPGLVQKAAAMGFTAVEIPMTDPRIPACLGEEIRESGLAVTLCAAMSAGRDLSSFDPQVRTSTMAYLTKCLEEGEKVHAALLCGPLYAGGGKRHVLDEEDRKREWDLSVHGLQELSRRASSCGMRLAIEPLNRYRTSVINTVSQGLAMVRDVDSHALGLHYDTFHAALEEADLLGSLEQALSSGKVYHFHACANNRGEPGAGVLPWERIFEDLKKYGYQSHITMETFAPGGLDASYINVHGTPDEVATRGIAFLKKYF